MIFTNLKTTTAKETSLSPVSENRLANVKANLYDAMFQVLEASGGDTDMTAAIIKNAALSLDVSCCPKRARLG